MKSLNSALAAVALIGGVALSVPEASAMPVAPAASVAGNTGVQEARLVCGPFRCVRTFGYRRPIYRPYYRVYRPFRYYRRPIFRVF